MFSESLTIAQESDIIGSKSVTKVQNLPSVGIWNETNVLLKDYIKSYFSKKIKLLKFFPNQTFPTRKRVTILTPENNLLIYETNCTGYVFVIENAKKLETSSSNKAYSECILSLKFEFGIVSLVLMNHQISIWRRTLHNIFENQQFDQSLLSEISLYTAKDELEEYETDTEFDYTDHNISLKSAQGYTNVQIPNKNTSDAFILTRTNSNRSLTYLPSTIRSATSVNSKFEFNRTLTDSIRRGRKCVSSLAKKFEGKLKKHQQQENDDIEEEEVVELKTPPILFPTLPVRKLEDVQKEDVKITRLDYTPRKNKPDY